MSARTVDARFAGGTLFVQQDDEYIGDGQAVVVLDIPGHNDLALFPREARALADALRAEANGISRDSDRRIRRRADANDELQERDA